MSEQRTIDNVPVAHTPVGGWTTWPPPVLAGCVEAVPAEAPDLDGYWRTVEVLVDDKTQPEHPGLDHVQRVEQRGDRLVVTGGGVIHDMRCDGTLERGVHDVAGFDKTTGIEVVASYEDGVHVLRPDGLPIEVRRRREGSQMLWDYVGFTARLEYLAPSCTDPADVAGLTAD
ncbi:MAG: hypothetical protein VYA26_09310 [Actinomycetota bacterium]|nr:hypothetical protein [Actinomycetota bacterium]